MAEYSQETEREGRFAPVRQGRHFRILLIARILIFLSLTAAFLWYSDRRLRKLDLQIRTAQEQAAAVSAQVHQFSRQLDALRETTETARKDASEAKQKAKVSEEAQRQSDLEAQRRREESEKARAETQEVRGELDRIRQARQLELDRMQEALNQVAPTRRTSSGMVIELANESFRFDFDKATLRPENRELLSRIAGILLASKGYSLFVYGHTDDVGTEQYNQDLSERRAKSVQDYLVKAGIPAAMVRMKGFGKSSPLVNAKTRGAREKNRRVEIGIVDTIVQYKGEVQNAKPGSPPAPPDGPEQ